MSLAGERMLGRGARGLLALGAVVVGSLAGAAPAAAQQNTKPPAIQGSDPRQEGQTLTATPGAWSPSISVSRQWLRCDSGAESSCAGIPGASGLSYTLVPADVGKRIRIRETETACFLVFCSSAVSEPTGVVLPDPFNTGPPSISGTARENETLSVASNGDWLTVMQPLTFAYQWRRCDAAGAGCVNLIGAQGAGYKVNVADVGHTIRVAVTASNSRPRTSAAAQSAPSAVVQAVPPAQGGSAPGTFLLPSPPAPTATPSLLTPFPLVVIAGRLFRSGARITLLGVRAPRGSSVLVRCRGRSCPARRTATHVGRRGRLRVRRFQRLLRTGVVIEVFVTKPNRIGKYTRFRIRSRRRPARRDLCVFPGQRRPSRCPSL